MSFDSVHFLIFLPIVLLVYYLIPQRVRALWLLVASYYFYMSWNPKYALLILLSTILTYITGILIESTNETFLRKLYVALCIVINLSILFSFKYLNFFIDNINGVFNILGIDHSLKHMNWLLPVGISFYTFQAIGYIIDVYRGNIKVERNIVYYALFISFFPQLVAGPIERAGNILTQIRTEAKKVDVDKLLKGFLLVGWGLFEKSVVSDRIALVVDEIFGNYSEYGLMPIVVATIIFTIEVYCDFDAYSNIARGAASMFGYDLMINFKQPFLATTVVDFWKRWHISLTGWFRDYLYIPLGGNRKGKVRQCINIFIVFLVSGLWHGASWTFVIWGGINGIAQIVSHLRNKADLNTRISFSTRLLRTATTFGIYAFSMFFFRVSSMKEALEVFGQMKTRVGDFGMITSCMGVSDWRILILGLLLLLIIDVMHEKKIAIVEVFKKQDVWFRYLVYVGIIAVYFYLGMNFGLEGQHQFIYFQF